MIVPKRFQQTPPSSFSSSTELVRSSSPSTPPSPPRTPPRGHRSMSKLSWLSRSSTSSSSRSNLITPIRVKSPEPKRNNTLGTGAVVVRTPQEAVVQMNRPEKRLSGSRTDRDLPSPPSTPSSSPLPAVPLSKSSPNLPLRKPSTPPLPTRPPPPVPAPPAPARPSLKSSTPSTCTEYSPPVPSLPSNVTASPLQPPFQAILLSSVPNNAVDPSKIIVTLETCTTIHRTTLSTLASRPSFLSSYLTSLFPTPDAESIYSNASDINGSFNSIFHNHLTSSGVLPYASSNLHIFLDRPSTPYAHILTYLRSPPSTPENPTLLPRAAQLSSCSSSRLEALLELRDEARYLDLDELYRLCTDEIRQRETVILHAHARGTSSGSTGSNGSVRSVRSVSETKHSYRVSSDTLRSARTSVTELGVILPTSPPAPQLPIHDRSGSESPVPATALGVKSTSPAPLQLTVRGRIGPPIPIPGFDVNSTLPTPLQFAVRARSESPTKGSPLPATPKACPPEGWI